VIEVGMPPIPVAVPISVVTFGNMGRYSLNALFLN
jgi:hypothetical protein